MKNLQGHTYLCRMLSKTYEFQPTHDSGPCFWTTAAANYFPVGANSRSTDNVHGDLCDGAVTRDILGRSYEAAGKNQG